jgi:hypothetical protein
MSLLVYILSEYNRKIQDFLEVSESRIQPSPRRGRMSLFFNGLDGTGGGAFTLGGLPLKGAWFPKATNMQALL